MIAIKVPELVQRHVEIVVAHQITPVPKHLREIHAAVTLVVTGGDNEMMQTLLSASKARKDRYMRQLSHHEMPNNAILNATETQKRNVLVLYDWGLYRGVHCLV